jgi:hypothetical protein
MTEHRPHPDVPTQFVKSQPLLALQQGLYPIRPLAIEGRPLPDHPFRQGKRFPAHENVKTRPADRSALMAIILLVRMV